MTQLLDLTAYRSKAFAQRAFASWQKRFGESYGAETRLADLTDKTLYFLARPGEETALAHYELIMGILDMGKGPKFYYLDHKDQLMVTDVQLFLIDQVRFELMRRLGWLTSFPGEDYTLLEMVQAFETIKAEVRQKSVALPRSHPEYNAYNELTNADKQVFLRRRIVAALKEFGARFTE
jgi:hypothetical protein